MIIKYMGVCKSLNSNTQFEEKNSPCGEGNWFWTLTFEWYLDIYKLGSYSLI